MTEQIINCLLRHRHIPIEDRFEILRSFQTRFIKTGDWLIQAGQVARQLYFIKKGVLKITVPHSQEKDMVYFFMKEGQFMSFLYSMYANIPAQQGLQAACDTDLQFINYEHLLLLYKKLPYLKALIDEIAHLSMANMVTLKNAYMTGEALEKYKLFLQRQSEIANHVKLGDVASYLGITPQSLSRIRREYALL